MNDLPPQAVHELLEAALFDPEDDNSDYDWSTVSPGRLVIVLIGVVALAVLTTVVIRALHPSTEV